MSATASESLPPVLRGAVADIPWDDTTEVIVVGSGAAGWSAAIAAQVSGAQALVVEKAGHVGGTTAQAGGAWAGSRASTWLWICNNHLMQAQGIDDSRERALRYMARLAEPLSYRPEAENLGLRMHQFETLEAFYDHGSRVVRTLHELGVLDFLIVPEVLDYYSDLPENTAPHGRTLGFRVGSDHEGIGAELIDALQHAADAHGVRLRLQSPVRAVVVDPDSGRVNGVVSGNRAGDMQFIRALRGVVFATGGFASSSKRRRTFLRGPILAGLSARGNTGDFLDIASELGAVIDNMNEAWLTPIVLDHVPDPPSGAFRLPGDSMLVVNTAGQRVVNEKATYNEFTRAFFHWDPSTASYPNLPLIMIYDQWVAEHCRQLPGDAPVTDGGGNPIPVQGRNDTHELCAETLAELSHLIGRHLEKYRHLMPTATLAPGFAASLRSSIERFNRQATTGHDPDFARGATSVQRIRSGPCHDPASPNPTMYPLSDRGPYYAVLLGPGALDTKGGPAIDADGRIRARRGGVIPGLYGAGNCVASPAGQGYWGGGATLGLAVTFGYLAGEHAAREQR
ncbi:FAD-dependent oxidoreductase [Nocardia sp. CA-107356]|uniref:FAD-dependent oxidoreductase n=1 Tax=Nocardia sp. CA-107356 TaxID=3239972 RepID=UPI003D93789A